MFYYLSKRRFSFILSSGFKIGRVLVVPRIGYLCGFAVLFIDCICFSYAKIYIWDSIQTMYNTTIASWIFAELSRRQLLNMKWQPEQSKSNKIDQTEWQAKFLQHPLLPERANAVFSGKPNKLSGYFYSLR